MSDTSEGIARTIESEPVLSHWPHMRAAEDAQYVRSLAATAKAGWDGLNACRAERDALAARLAEAERLLRVRFDWSLEDEWGHTLDDLRRLMAHDKPMLNQKYGKGMLETADFLGLSDSATSGATPAQSEGKP